MKHNYWIYTLAGLSVFSNTAFGQAKPEEVAAIQNTPSTDTPGAIAVHNCPNMSGTYRFDGIQDKDHPERACTTNSPDKAFAYPIPTAIHSAWHIQPGKTFRLEQEGCDQITVVFDVANSNPSEHREVIHLKPAGGQYYDERFSFDSNTIVYTGKADVSFGGGEVPGSGRVWRKRSFSMSTDAKGNLQVASNERDIGAMTVPPFGIWDSTSFKCHFEKVASSEQPNSISSDVLNPNESVHHLQQPHSDASKPHEAQRQAKPADLDAGKAGAESVNNAVGGAGSGVAK